MKRTYNDKDRAAALANLAANDGDLTTTAAQCGVPYHTLRRWAKSKLHLAHSKKKELSDCLQEVAYALCEAMPGKIGKASLQQTAVSLGIAVEKMRLLREQSTSNTAISLDLSLLTDAELDEYERFVRATENRIGALSAPAASVN